ncbi:MAG: endonuclease/exonuclease/phosphatase family protein [Candidatus Dojkabacteria bacterium]|nr:endonuclease/exonuclease/phosphatase family protein [Candidatus Dojkabacteria bacterium]MDQ7021322.1 endonuclease/exonuclease/phosphatase family protein [Candidatus Dojkabacteria bacterium]
MKLLSLNAAYFINNNDKVIDFIKTQDADIVCLQEVSRHIDESVKYEYKLKSQLDNVISDNYQYKFYSPCVVSNNFQKVDEFYVDFGGFTEFGTYILSKNKIKYGEAVIQNGSVEYVADWSNWPNPDFARPIQTVKLDIDGQEIIVINLHGLWSKSKQGSLMTNEQSKGILRLIEKYNLPTIVCGDFNLFPNTESIRLLDAKLKNLCNEYKINTTRPSDNLHSSKDRNVVDYIFTSKEIKVNHFEVVDSNISDHLPLLLNLDIS